MKHGLNFWSACAQYVSTHAQCSLHSGVEQEGIAQKYGLGRETSKTPPVKSEWRKRNPYVFQSMKAKVNIPGVSATHLQANVQRAGFERTSAVQLDVLKHVHEANPNGRWVIKADGCGVHKGLRESVRHKWSGDVDLVMEVCNGCIARIWKEENMLKVKI